jgi:hypothetical protein
MMRVVSNPAAGVVARGIRSIVLPRADVKINSQATPTGPNRGEMTIRVTGRMHQGADPYDVELTAQGSYYFESSFGGLEQRQLYTVSGVVSSVPGAVNAVELTVQEEYTNERVVSEGVSVSTADTSIHNQWRQNEVAYAADNWRIRRSFRDGAPSQLDSYWHASGALLQNRLPIFYGHRPFALQ